jgi:hypothetical protein
MRTREDVRLVEQLAAHDLLGIPWRAARRRNISITRLRVWRR